VGSARRSTLRLSGALFALLAFHCAGKTPPRGPAPPSPPEIAFAVARPGATWPILSDTECEIALDPQATGETFSLYETYDLKREVVRLGFGFYKSGFVGKLGRLPPAGTDPSVRYTVDEPMKLDGFRALPVEAVIQRRVDVVPGHVWIPKGAIVEIYGMNGDQLVVRAESPFGRPSGVEATVGCDNVGSFARRDEPKPPPNARKLKLAKRAIALSSAPGGPVLVGFEPSDALPPDGPTILELERRAGFVRIRATRPAGNCDFDFVSATFDGWIPEDAVERELGPKESERSSCDGSDRTDSCSKYSPVVTHSVPVFAGERPEGTCIGILRPSARVHVSPEGARDGFMPFSFDDHGIEAVKGSFWVASSFAYDDEGCPASEKPFVSPDPHDVRFDVRSAGFDERAIRLELVVENASSAPVDVCLDDHSDYSFRLYGETHNVGIDADSGDRDCAKNTVKLSVGAKRQVPLAFERGSSDDTSPSEGRFTSGELSMNVPISSGPRSWSVTVTVEFEPNQLRSQRTELGCRL
jgi:hypothetical protein